MLQYLLDEHLPGYHLPIRRLRASTWFIDPYHHTIKLWDYVVDSIHQRYDVMAIKDSRYIYRKVIVCNDRKEYLITLVSNYTGSCENSDVYYACIGYTYLPSSNFDLNSYLI